MFIKEAILKQLKRKPKDGKGSGRMEWALVSKSNPKKILRWFGPQKPSHERIVKEERRIHSFSSLDNGDSMIKDLIILANNLDSAGLLKEADLLDSIIKESAKKKSEKQKPTKEQLEAFDLDKDGKPFEKEDFKMLRKKKK